MYNIYNVYVQKQTYFETYKTVTIFVVEKLFNNLEHQFNSRE